MMWESRKIVDTHDKGKTKSGFPLSGEVKMWMSKRGSGLPFSGEDD
jgi:hypothetical protein